VTSLARVFSSMYCLLLAPGSRFRLSSCRPQHGRRDLGGCLSAFCVRGRPWPTESTAILPRDFMNSNFPETRSLRRGCNQPGLSLRSACGSGPSRNFTCPRPHPTNDDGVSTSQCWFWGAGSGVTKSLSPAWWSSLADCCCSHRATEPWLLSRGVEI
jgi:hypothetical protein